MEPITIISNMNRFSEILGTISTLKTVSLNHCLKFWGKIVGLCLTFWGVIFQIVHTLSSHSARVILSSIIIIDLLADTFAFAQSTSEIFLLLFIVVSKKLLPVGRVGRLQFLLNDFRLNFRLVRKMGKWRNLRGLLFY